jgi:hypothetical protein
LNVTEIEIRRKYRYSKLSYVFDVYMECEYRANLTQKEYDGLMPGEFRFDYESWGRRLGYTKKQMERAIKELTTKNIVIIQTLRGNKGTCSKYFLARFQENNKEHNKENKRRGIPVGNTGFNDVLGEQKEKNKENKKEHSSQHNNLNIISNNIYSDFDKEVVRETDNVVRIMNNGSTQNEQQVVRETNTKNTNKNTNKKIYSDFDKIVCLYPGKKIKAIRDKKLPGIIKQYGDDQIIRCVKRYADECKGKEKQYILNESTFWNGRYIDYLDDNYKEVVKASRNHDIEDYIQI